MDNDSIAGVKLLKTIGDCRDRFAQFSVELQKRSDVLSAESNLECITLPTSGTILDFYIDVELINGNCITYFLGLRWGENEWVISTRISINDEQGYEVLRDFQDRRTENFEELLTFLTSAVSELLSNSAIIDYRQM